MRRDSRKRPNAFTLIELLVVMAIIGILMAFILIAAQDGVHRAQEKATLALISKLDIAVSERIDALSYRRADIYPGHVLMATISLNATTNIQSVDMRAQVVAQVDLVRAQLPDVFFVQVLPANLVATSYPLNFAGLSNPTVLPNSAPPPAFTVGGLDNGVPIGTFITTTSNAPQFPALGAFGATYQAAAGIYKNLGYLPPGYDGVDNNFNGLIDEYAEGVGTDPLIPDPSNPTSQINVSALIQKHLIAHDHKTARSEMLYAILVEGQGPFGSAFTRDDFSSKEVADTDGDGLPEFIDAWGHPLQFYRWPIYYNNDPTAGLNATAGGTRVAPIGGGSYIQKGMLPYGNPNYVTPANANVPYGDGIGESRQLDPLDPNQTLVSLGWWSSGVNTSPPGTGAVSADALQFMQNFYSLLEPYYHIPQSNPPPGSTWDRSGAFARRAFYSRFLIVSSGPDQQLGVAQLNVDYHSLYPSPALNGGPPLYLPSGTRDASGAPIPFPVPGNATASTILLTTIENQAGLIDPNRTGLLNEQEVGYYANAFPYNDTSFWIQQAAQDDITNQALASPGGGVR
jgi:prepilin-type N-terminal cleavage/methylation domain-containing protein